MCFRAQSYNQWDAPTAKSLMTASSEASLRCFLQYTSQRMKAGSSSASRMMRMLPGARSDTMMATAAGQGRERGGQ